MSPRPLTGTLTVAHGPRAGRADELSEAGVSVLGRGAECPPRVPTEPPSQDVSRHHCLVGLHPSKAWVLDLHSAYGTSVRGSRLAEQVQAEHSRIPLFTRDRRGAR